MNIYLDKLSSISISNKYFKWYCNIIINALLRVDNRKDAKKILGYCEGHHIIPRSFNLDNPADLNGIVYLSAKEHIIVHMLLTKFTINEYRTASLRAFHCMCFKTNGGQNKRSPSLIQLAMARIALSIANKGPRGINGPPNWSDCDTLSDFKKLIQMHVDANMSDPTIGKLYGISATAVFNWRRKLNIENRRGQLRDKDWLYNQYYNNKLSTGQIAELLGCTPVAVCQYLSKFRIPFRSPIERQQLTDKNKKGYFKTVDKFGNKFLVKKDDPRFLSGELISINKGLITVIDEKGNVKLVDKQTYKNNKNLKTPTFNKIAINDGLNTRYINKYDEIPSGWTIGRKSKD